MPLVSPDQGEVQLLSYMLGKLSPGNHILRLYRNNPTLDDNTTLSMVSEVTTPGYTAKTMTGTSWTVSTTTNVTQAVYSEQTFSFSTAASVYGYYVTNNSNTHLLWIEKFSGGPFLLPNSGGTIAVTPKINLKGDAI